MVKIIPLTITNLNVPDGYELSQLQWEKSVAYGDEEFVNVTVKKKEAKKLMLFCVFIM